MAGETHLPNSYIKAIKVSGTSYYLTDDSKSKVSVNGTTYTGDNTAAFYAPTEPGSVSGQILT